MPEDCFRSVFVPHQLQSKGLRDTRLTWVVETFPFMIALPVLLFTYKRFRLTNLMYMLIAVHAMILMLCGHYSYAPWDFGWRRGSAGPAVIIRACPVGDQQRTALALVDRGRLSGKIIEKRVVRVCKKSAMR